MGIRLEWLGHASFRISHDDTVIYIDPWKIKGEPAAADVVLISHGHYDHYSSKDITRVSNANTRLVASSDVINKENVGQVLSPGKILEMEGFNVSGIASYNPEKQFHPKSNNWLGFIIEIESKCIYYAGDTDLTDEMKTLTNIDTALLPVGGTYTMNAEQAAQAAEFIRPRLAIPYHWGDIVGDNKDAGKFAELAHCEVKVLEPGQILDIE
jgi:L-ascorbate metabolism protein UlaG (beta-lactamase superfamily)